jgi:hypothetical protein
VLGRGRPGQAETKGRELHECALILRVIVNHDFLLNFTILLVPPLRTIDLHLVRHFERARCPDAAVEHIHLKVDGGDTGTAGTWFVAALFVEAEAARPPGRNMQLRRQRRSGGEASLLLLLCFEALLGAVSFCPPRGYVARAAVPRAGFLPGCEATGADPVALARRSRRDVASRAQRSQPRAALRTYCPVPLAECPKVDSLFPPVPDRQLPPLIHHISAEKDWCSAVEMITTEVDMSNKLVFELLSFGAVYLSTPLVAGRRKQKAGLVEGMCKALRITEDMPVPRGSYVRVHANPKRHLVANAIDWSARILAQEDGLVVLDKPAGVPTVPTVDNLVESALFRVQQHIGQSLFSTSRLDTCTSGVVILARTPEACEAVNWAFRNRHVTKVYRVLCRGPVPLGTLRHCWRKRGTGAHANSKPSLLAPFDPALLEPPADHPEARARLAP